MSVRNAFALGLFAVLTLLPATTFAQTAAPAPLAAEQRSVRSERETAIGFWAAGGILMTGGGFTTFSYAFPGGFVAFWTGVAAGGLGFISLVVAIALTTSAHRHWDELRARGVSIGPGPGQLGLGLAVSF